MAVAVIPAEEDEKEEGGEEEGGEEDDRKESAFVEERIDDSTTFISGAGPGCCHTGEKFIEKDSCILLLPKEDWTLVLL
jgi:hypothetical protein